MTRPLVVLLATGCIKFSPLPPPTSIYTISQAAKETQTPVALPSATGNVLVTTARQAFAVVDPAEGTVTAHWMADGRRVVALAEACGELYVLARTSDSHTTLHTARDGGVSEALWQSDSRLGNVLADGNADGLWLLDTQRRELTRWSCEGPSQSWAVAASPDLLFGPPEVTHDHILDIGPGSDRFAVVSGGVFRFYTTVTDRSVPQRWYGWSWSNHLAVHEIELPTDDNPQKRVHLTSRLDVLAGSEPGVLMRDRTGTVRSTSGGYGVTPLLEPSIGWARLGEHRMTGWNTSAPYGLVRRDASGWCTDRAWRLNLPEELPSLEGMWASLAADGQLQLVLADVIDDEHSLVFVGYGGPDELVSVSRHPPGELRRQRVEGLVEELAADSPEQLLYPWCRTPSPRHVRKAPEPEPPTEPAQAPDAPGGS